MLVLKVANTFVDNIHFAWPKLTHRTRAKWNFNVNRHVAAKKNTKHNWLCYNNASQVNQVIKNQLRDRVKWNQSCLPRLMWHTTMHNSQFELVTSYVHVALWTCDVCTVSAIYFYSINGRMKARFDSILTVAIYSAVVGTNIWHTHAHFQ